MTSDLFPDCRQDSPRLAWMKRHGITVRKATFDELMRFEATYGIDDDEQRDYQFIASAPTGGLFRMNCYASTEEDALAGVAKAIGIPLWNEEQYAKEKTK